MSRRRKPGFKQCVVFYASDLTTSYHAIINMLWMYVPIVSIFVNGFLNYVLGIKWKDEWQDLLFLTLLFSIVLPYTTKVVVHIMNKLTKYGFKSLTFRIVLFFIKTCNPLRFRISFKKEFLMQLCDGSCYMHLPEYFFKWGLIVIHWIFSRELLWFS